MKHIDISKVYKKSLWRKNSVNNWKIKNDSSTYVSHSLNVEPLINFCKINNYSPFITFTKIISQALKDSPEANVILRGSKVYYRKTQNIFIHVTEDELNEELSGYVIYDPTDKSYEELNRETKANLKKIKSGTSFFASSQNLSKFIPRFMIRPLFKVSEILFYRLNINLFPRFIPKDCFGSILISNVGSIGLQNAFIPLVTHSGAHLALAFGKVQDKVLLIDNVPQNVPHVTLGFTFDHRVMDGHHLSQLIVNIEENIQSIK